jgi:hypothetical protein
MKPQIKRVAIEFLRALALHGICEIQFYVRCMFVCMKRKL